MASKSIAETTTNVKEETVEVFVPKVPGESPTVWVSVNGKSWQFPRGKKTPLPKYVADVLERSERFKEAAEQFSDEEQKKMKIIQGVDA